MPAPEVSGPRHGTAAAGAAATPSRPEAEAPRWPWRLFRPSRTIHPTRDGWWCLFAALGLGVAAVNTGNNLLYLLAALLLGLVVVSGVLSEMVMRGLALSPVVPEELYAGRPALVGALVVNRKRRAPSYSLALVPGGGGPDRVLYLPRLGAGEERLVTWEVRPARRGRQRLPGLRVTTRFPFGIFVKSGRLRLDEEVLVYPAVGPLPVPRLHEIAATGSRTVRRRGRGGDLHNLREYRPGDEPRLLHWRTTARTGVLTVRELEAETTTDTRIVLEGRGADAERLERGLSEAASLAVHLLDAGTAVEVAGAGLLVPLGRGRGQARRILEALALYEPAAGAGRVETGRSPMLTGPAPGAPAARERGPLREIRVGIG